MGGWTITTEGQEAYLNLPLRNLQGEVWNACDGFDVVDDLGCICDLTGECRGSGCAYAPGFILGGESHRRACQSAVDWLESHPDWQGEDRRAWSGGGNDREIALRMFRQLAALEGDRVYYWDDLCVWPGCPKQWEAEEAEASVPAWALVSAEV